MTARTLPRRAAPIVTVIVLAGFLTTSPGRAVDLGTPALVNQGIDQFGTTQGTVNAPAPGNNFQSGSQIGDLVGGGGNSVTVCIPDLLAAEIERLEFTTTSCPCAGTQVVDPITATNGLGVCNDINASSFTQGCNDRGAATCSGDPGRLMDLVGPFDFGTSCTNCQTGNFVFLGNSVPSSPSVITITNLTNTGASDADFFSVRLDGTLIEIGPFALGGVTNGAQLATTITGLSALITGSYAGTTLTITAANDGPKVFSDLRLEKTTAATTTSWNINNLDDLQAGAANAFSLSIDGVLVNQAAVDLDAATNLNTLATELDKIPGIDVSNTATSLLVDASAPGARVFSSSESLALPLGLEAIPPQVSKIDTVAGTGDGILAEGENTNVGITQLLVSFDPPGLDPPGDVQPEDVTNPANYLLIEDGANDLFDTTTCAGGTGGDDTQIGIAGVTYNGPTKTATVVPFLGAFPGLGPGSYRLLVCGTTSIEDVLGQKLDGNNDGVGGDDFVRNFVVLDFDMDGDPDFNDLDDDNDGMSDQFEEDNSLDPKDASDAGLDNDLDGLTNLEEFQKNPNLDPHDPDTDDDGIGDALDMDPINMSNLCNGGDLDEGTITGTITTDLTCAAFISINVLPMTFVENPGHLYLFSPTVLFQQDFEAFGLTVTNTDPCPNCSPPSAWQP